jgi:hypothetical protein
MRVSPLQRVVCARSWAASGVSSWSQELYDFSEGFINRQGREFFDAP